MQLESEPGASRLASSFDVQPTLVSHFACQSEQFTFSDAAKVNCWYDLWIFRENHSSRAYVFDGYDTIEEGGHKASSSYSSTKMRKILTVLKM